MVGAVELWAEASWFQSQDNFLISILLRKLLLKKRKAFLITLYTKCTTKFIGQMEVQS